MQYINHYHSPLGKILLAADEIGLTGLWFEGQKHFARYLHHAHEERELLYAIPYGKTTTYGEIAKQLAVNKGLPHMSAQAVLRRKLLCCNWKKQILKM